MGESRSLRTGAGKRPARGRPLCEECGRPIPIKRLRANPFATRCYVCQVEVEHSIRHDPTARDVCPVCGHGLMWKPIGRRFSAGYRLVCARHPECGFQVVASAS
jgi:hypothetical protein